MYLNILGSHSNWAIRRGFDVPDFVFFPEQQEQSGPKAKFKGAGQTKRYGTHFVKRATIDISGT
jgi:hypothetical protein